MFKHILIPTDGSELSQVTAKRAISFAKEAGARVTVFFAKPEYPIAYFGEGALIDRQPRKNSPNWRSNRPPNTWVKSPGNVPTPVSNAPPLRQPATYPTRRSSMPPKNLAAT